MSKYLTCKVITDEFTAHISESFDFEFTGESRFKKHTMKAPKDFNLGVIYGSSGSGKSILLKEFGEEESLQWDENRAIVSHFKTPDEAVNRLFAVGLASIPTLCRPYHVLSTGEKFRADMSRRIKNNAVIDEYTSTVNRETAKSLSVALSNYVRRNNIKNVVLASCHEDILDWLEPDWVYNTDYREFNRNSHVRELNGVRDIGLILL